MRYFGGKLGEFIVYRSLSHNDKKSFKKLFNEIEVNPENFKLTYERNDGQINMVIESIENFDLDHYNSIELPISFSINEMGGVDVLYVSSDGERKELSFNMGRKAYNRVEQIIDKFGEDNSDTKI